MPHENEIDYEKLGLKIGLELHQQLNTKKLFCNCSSNMDEKKLLYEIRRRLRPATGEMGKVDRAALFEFFRNRDFVYHGYEGEACLVDTDDEPPHAINPEALNIALSLAILLKMEIPDEIHVMRKTVVDGSAITSFQRTMLVGFGNPGFHGIRLKSLCLEEDAAKPEDTQENRVVYSLSRLGIPLIELATEPDIKSPKQCREVAENMGLLFRSFNVKRGIGTIRQDINISIKEGARVEIKGWQDLRTLEKLIKNEVCRQASMVEIKKALEKSDSRMTGCVDVSDIFGIEACALKLPKFSKIIDKELCEGKTLFSEISDYAKAYGTEAIIYDKSMDKEFAKAEEIVGASKDDIVLVLRGKGARKSSCKIEERIRLLYCEVPEETRKPNPDCTTSFARPLPGSDRMYPETDCLPVIIEKSMIENLRKSLPKTMLEKKNMLEEELPKDIAGQIIRSRYYQLFDRLSKGKSKEVKLAIATSFTSTLKDLARNGMDTEKITEDDFSKIFIALEKKKIAKTSIPEIFIEIMTGKPLAEAVEKYSVMDDAELERRIWEIANQNRGKPISAVMGIVMSSLGGKADGKKVMEILKRVMEKNFEE